MPAFFAGSRSSEFRSVGLAAGLEERVDGGNEICGDFEGLSIVGGGKQFVSEAADLMLELPHWSLLRNRVVVDHVDGDDSGLASLDWESQTDVKQQDFFLPAKVKPPPRLRKMRGDNGGAPSG